MKKLEIKLKQKVFEIVVGEEDNTSLSNNVDSIKILATDVYEALALAEQWLKKREDSAQKEKSELIVTDVRLVTEIDM